MQNWINEFKDKNILIYGYGIEGKSTYRFIRSLLPEQVITIADGKACEQAKNETVHTICIDDSNLDFSLYDIVMKAPGIILDKTYDNVTSQSELFLKHYRNQTIGITGTKGKSTTTSLVAKVLSVQYPTVLVGNIGVACFDAIEQMENGALAAFEISCHQLEFTKVSPHIGVYLNLFEEHLDHYGSFKKYGDAKFNNMKYMQKGDIAIMHPMLSAYGYIEQCHVKPLLIGEDIYADRTTLHFQQDYLEIHDCKLIGNHNYQNLAIAYAIAKIYGIDDEKIQQAISTFEPLHHRLENLGIFNGIRYVNDSISTIGQASIQALEALDDVDVILIGGKDRQIDYTDLENYLFEKTTVKVIFMYASGLRVYNEMAQKNQLRKDFYLTEDLAEAMKLAKKICTHGKTVLLSPAASSYDHFKNFEQRGAIFEEMAKSL